MKHKRFDHLLPYTYYIKHKPTGCLYHGVRWGNVKKGIPPNQDLGQTYFTSGRLKPEFKANPALFEVHLKWTFDSVDEARNHEQKVNTKLMKYPLWENWNNGQAIIIPLGVVHQRGVVSHSDHTKQLISESSKARWQDPEYRRRVMNSQQNRVKPDLTDEQRQAISTRMSGRVLTKETREKISQSKTGQNVKRTSDHNRKIGDAHRGKTHPWQDKINKNPDKIAKTAEAHKGTTRSTTAKENINRSKSIFVTDQFFSGWYITPIGAFYSSKVAAEYLGCDDQIVRKRCITNNNKPIRSSKSILIELDVHIVIGTTWAENGWGFVEWKVSDETKKLEL